MDDRPRGVASPEMRLKMEGILRRVRAFGQAVEERVRAALGVELPAHTRLDSPQQANPPHIAEPADAPSGTGPMPSP